MPPIGRLLGHVDFSNLFVSLSGDALSTRSRRPRPRAPRRINYGLFLNTVINFLIVAFAVFLLVRQVNRLAPKPAPAAAPATRDCPYCLTLCPLKATNARTARRNCARRRSSFPIPSWSVFHKEHLRTAVLAMV